MGSTNGVSRGQLRPYLSGRTPPFLVVGLLVVMGILGFSYWSLNTQYTERQEELLKLQERLRIYAEKRESVEKQNSALQSQLQESQNEEGKFKIALDKKQQEVNNLAEQLRYKEDDVAKTITQMQELKINVEKCESITLEKKTEFDQLNDKIQQLLNEKKETEIVLEELRKSKSSLNNPPDEIPLDKKNKPELQNKVEVESNNIEDSTISQSKHLLSNAKNVNASIKPEISADPDVGPPPENREARALKTTTKMPVSQAVKEKLDIAEIENNSVNETPSNNN